MALNLRTETTAWREIIVTSELKHLPMTVSDNEVPGFLIAVNGVSSIKAEIGDTELRICKLTQGDNEESPCHLMIMQRYTIILLPKDSENELLKQQFYWWRIVKDIVACRDICCLCDEHEGIFTKQIEIKSY